MIKEAMADQVSRFYLFRQDLPFPFLACRLTICRFGAFGSKKTEAKRVGSTKTTFFIHPGINLTRKPKLSGYSSYR
ncbi:hypothetical protein SLEP1_g59927 [Rubroshorea leprosula]|uniref:Uncharacterized protein n=1 Tax=Rubroshorea leprosula TaxID=152421 RepID=A0AAV5MXW5_9ROSI|nr:hypothetical protein SLEP1_g59927 [Rubroshorea leprosula]